MTTYEQAAVLSPESMVEEFKKNGVTHIVTIPDSETNYLYELMMEQPWLEVIPSAREGETFAIALGLIIGGKKPVCLIQNTGMLESGDSIRGMALDPGLDSPRGDFGLGGALHGAVPERHADQLLSVGGRHRQFAHFDGL